VRSMAAAGQVDLERAGRLVTTGPYAVSRNPMCLAWALIHLGVGVGIGSAWTVVTLPAAVVRIDREIAREERWLAVRFGEEFAEYRAAVPRYLPRTQGWTIRRRPPSSVG
jgi:protein-S-isoprenylcysteine O-methyltransferase Ste14